MPELEELQELESPENLNDNTALVPAQPTPNEQSVFWMLLPALAWVLPARIFSLFCYYLSLQIFMRGGLEEFLLAVDFSPVSNAYNILSDLLQAVLPAAANANALHSEEELQQVFLAGHLEVIPLFILLSVFSQVYVASLPLLGRSESEVSKLRIVAGTTTANHFPNLILRVHANFGYGLNQSRPLMPIYVVGGTVMLGSYLGLRQLSREFELFFLANFFQASLICVLYLLYLEFFSEYKKLSWTKGLLKTSDWRNAWTERSVKLLNEGLHPALITAAKVVFTAMTSVSIENPVERAAYQALQIFILVLTAMTIAVQQQNSKFATDLRAMYKENPEALSKKSQQLLFHSNWLGNVLPLIFFMVCFLARRPVVSALVSDTEANKLITAAVIRDLLFPLILMLLETLRAAGYGIIFSTRRISDPTYKKYNQLATAVNIIAAALSFFAGLALERAYGMGARGYWLSLCFFTGISAVFQQFYAVRTIQHAKVLATAALTRQPIEVVVEPSQKCLPKLFSCNPGMDRFLMLNGRAEPRDSVELNALPAQSRGMSP